MTKQHHKLCTWPWQKPVVDPDDEIVDTICSRCWVPIRAPDGDCFTNCEKCAAVSKMNDEIRIDTETLKRQTKRDKDFLIAQAYFKDKGSQDYDKS